MNSRLPYNRKKIICKRQLQRCKTHVMYGADFGFVDPYIRMAEGVGPSWNHRDPRAALTDVSAMTNQQSHPQMNGACGFSVWSWLKGEYR